MHAAGLRVKAYTGSWVLDFFFISSFAGTALHQCRTVPLVLMPCSWDELPTHIPSLRISAPDGLFSGSECLTFITNGTYVYTLI